MTANQLDSHRDMFLEGMSKAACTVNIVTTDGNAGRAGLTVSAMCSVSADPTSLLVCVHEQSRSCDVINENKVFCVNVLNENQSHISNSFAGRLSTDDKFACADWERKLTGAPVLKNSLTNFDCHLKKSFKWGSHFIFIGEVAQIGVQDNGNPLIYANRAYGRAIPLSDDDLKLVADNDNENQVRLGSFLTISAFFIPALLSDYRRRGNTAGVKLVEGKQEELLDMLKSKSLDLAIIYLEEQTLEVETELLFEIPPYVLLPSEHPLAKQERVSLTDLVNYPMITLQSPSGGADYIDGLFKQAGVKANKGFIAPSFEVLRGMVGHGLGYAITITKPSSNMTYDGAALARRPIAEPVSPVRLVMAYQGSNLANKLVSEFIQYTKEYFQELDSNNAFREAI